MRGRSVLVLEADARHATHVEACIEKLGLAATVMNRPGAFVDAVTVASVGVGMSGLVVDYSAMFEPRLPMLAELVRLAAGAPVLLVLDGASLTVATRAGRLGVADTLCKPADALAVQQVLRPGKTPEIVVQPMSLWDVEQEHIRSSLERNGNNISATARQLRIARRSLQRKLQRQTPR